MMLPADHSNVSIYQGRATAGNNRKVHVILREQGDSEFLTMCGIKTPRRPQTTQERLPKCRRCFPV